MSITIKFITICIFVGVFCTSKCTPQKTVIQSFLEHQKNLKPRESMFPSSRGTVLNDFIYYNLLRPSQLNPSSTLQDDPQPSSSGSSTAGLSTFLLILSNLSNRPLSDQSVASAPGGIISSGVAAVQETFGQVGSNVQQGFNSVFRPNQGNEASSSNWSPVRPIGNTSSPSKPSFCPSNCTMVCGMPQQKSGSVRVVGGAEVTPSNKYPWLALIQYYERNVGTGTLVNDRVVLTSATIVSSTIIFKQIKVVFGAFDASSATETARKEITVTKARVHPQYSADNPMRNNIGFLQLAVPVTITDSFMPICLPSNVDTFADTNGTLAGWGARGLGGEPWKTLQEAQIPLYSYDECLLAYCNSTEDNICGGVFDPAPKDQHRTSCTGDGGTGLMYPWKHDPSILTLVGIALEFPESGCGKMNEPALFTKVYGFLPWLKSQVAGCNCKV